jgi:hypothetical protein
MLVKVKTLTGKEIEIDIESTDKVTPELLLFFVACSSPLSRAPDWGNPCS